MGRIRGPSAAGVCVPLLFLMNDVVLNVDAQANPLPLDVARFRELSLAFVVQLGQELYAEHPRLQHTDVEKAKRLALLLISKAPEINAALFVAPAQSCAHADVANRFCSISVEIMASLYAKQEAGALDAVAADKEIWRRLAA
jgi:hypothetical protein